MGHRHRRIRIRIHPMAAILVAGMALITLWTACTGQGTEGWLPIGEVAAVALAAILHELGHVAGAWGWSIPIRSLRLDLFGARMELEGLTGYAAELAVAAGGPLVSILGSALVRPLGEVLTGAYLFSSVSLGMGLLNLLPVRGLDGGRILSCALSLTAGERVADVTLRITTGLALGGLWLMSVYALLRVGEALTLFTFALCLLIRLLSP